MTVPFNSLNSTTRLAYTTSAGTANIAPASLLNIVNPDTANIVIVSAGYSNVTANLTAGVGTVIAPASTAQLTFNTNGANATTMFVSVIGGSTSGNIYITPGSL